MAESAQSGAVNTMLSNSTFLSSGLTLSSYFARPNGVFGPLPGVILCHGFPIGPLDARQSAGTFPQVIDRMANEVGCAALTFTFRGCGASEGDFSLQGWVDDLRAAIDHLVAIGNVDSVWLVGTNTGASVALCVAADDPRVTGCVSLSGRADFDDWAEQPRRFLEHARDIGAIRRAGFPQNFDEWSRELRRFRPTDAARRFAPRPLMVLHGDDDESVPATDTRQLAEAHGAAEMRVLEGAGHRMRHDPRAMAVLFGWLDRQRLDD